MFPSSFADHPGVQQPPAVLSHIPFRAHDAPDSMGNDAYIQTGSGPTPLRNSSLSSSSSLSAESTTARSTTALRDGTAAMGRARSTRGAAGGEAGRALSSTEVLPRDNEDDGKEGKEGVEEMVQAGMPIGFLAARGTPYAKKPLYRSKKCQVVCPIVGLVGLVVVVAIAIFPVLRAVAIHTLHTSVLTISSSNITSPTNGAFGLTLEGQVHKVGIFPAHLFFHNPVDVYWIAPENLTDELHLGQFDMAYIGIAAGHGRIKQQTEFQIINEPGFARFTEYLITQEAFTWRLKSTEVQAKAFGFLEANHLDFVKDLTLPGMANMTDVSISDFQLPGDDPAGGISLAVTTKLTNPSAFGVEMGILTVDLYYEDLYLGPAQTSQPTNLTTGVNYINLVGRLIPYNDNPTALAQLSVLFSNYLNGLPTPTQARGRSVTLPDGQVVDWLQKGIEALVLNVNLQSATGRISPIQGITIEALSLAFDPATPYQPMANSSEVSATFGLPFGFSLNISDLANEFSIVDNRTAVAGLSAPLGQAQTTILSKNAGYTSGDITLDLPLAPLTIGSSYEEHAAFDQFTYDLTTTNGSKFLLIGTTNAVTDTPLGQVFLQDIAFTVPAGLIGLESLTEYPTLILSVDVVGGTSDAVVLSLNVGLTNPSNLDLTVGDVTFQLFSGSSFLGTAVLPDLHLTRGYQERVSTSNFQANGNAEALKVLTDFTQGTSNDLIISGFNGSTPIEPLTQAFMALHLNTTLNGLTTKLLNYANLTVLDTTGVENNLANSIVSLQNPFTATLQISNIQSTITHSSGLLVGSITTNTDFQAVGKQANTSPILGFAINLFPPDIFALLRVLAVDAGLPTEQLDGIVALGGYTYTPTNSSASQLDTRGFSLDPLGDLDPAAFEYSGEDDLAVASIARRTLEKRSNMYTGFDLPSFTLAAFADLKVNVALLSVLHIEEFVTDLVYSQAEVPAHVDDTLLLLLPVLAQPIVQKIVDGSILAISTVLISDPTDASFTTGLVGTITNAGPFDGTISFPEGLTVAWNGKPLGQITMPNVTLVADVGVTLEVTAAFAVADLAHLTDFTSYLLTEPSFTWEIYGQNLAISALGITVGGISISKTVVLAGMNGFKGGVIIESFDLPANDPAGGVTLTLQTSLVNPSSVGMALSTIGFQNTFGATNIGPAASTSAFVLLPKATIALPLAGRLVSQTSSQGLADVSTIFNGFLHGVPSQLVVHGDTAGPPDVSWLNEGIKSLAIAVILPAAQNLQVINSITIAQLTLMFTEATAYAPMFSTNDTTAMFQIPFAFPVNIFQAATDIVISDPTASGLARRDAGDFAALNVPMGPSTTNVEVRSLLLTFENIPFQSSDNGIFSSFLHDTTVGSSQGLGLHGSASTIASTAIGDLSLSDIGFSVQTSVLGLQGLNARPAIVSDLDVFHGYPSYLQINVNAQLYNPSTQITIGTGDVAFGLTFNGESIGTADISNLILVPGVNIVPTAVHYSPSGGAATAQGQLLLENYIQGIPSDTLIVGNSGTTPIPSLQAALAAIQLAATIPPLQQNLVTEANLAFPLDIGTTSIASATISLANPFTAEINIISVVTNASYEGINLGMVNVGSLSPAISAPGHTNITSQTLPFTLNTDPRILVQFLEAAATAQNVNLGLLLPEFAYLLSEASTVSNVTTSVNTQPETCTPTGTTQEVDGLILAAVKNLKTNLSIQAITRLDEYQTPLDFVQNDVATVLGPSVVYLTGIIGKTIVSNIVDAAVLVFSQGLITNVTDAGFTVALTGTLSNAGPFDALLEFPDGVIVHWQGSAIATISLPPICSAGSAGASIATSGILTITDLSAFTDFSTYILLNPSFTWTISTPTLRVLALGTIFENVAMSKDISFQAFNGLPGVTIHDPNFPGDAPDGIQLVTDSLIPSPANLGIDLGDASFLASFEGQEVGPIEALGLTLAPLATTSTTLSGTIVKRTSDASTASLGVLFSQFLAGVNQTLQVTGQSVTSPAQPNSPVTWLSAAFKKLTLNVILPGQIFTIISSIQLEDLTVTITDATEAYLPQVQNNVTNVVYKNPFGFSLTAVETGGNFVINYGGTDAALLVLPVKDVVSAETSTGNDANLVLDFKTMTPLQSLDTTAFDSFFSAITNTASVPFVLHGAANVSALTNAGTILITSIPFSVPTTFAGIDGFGGKAIIPATPLVIGSGAGNPFAPSEGADFVRITLSVILSNPAPLILNTNMVSFGIIYEGYPVGRTYINPLNLIPGTNTIPAEFQYSPADPGNSVAQSLLANYLETSGAIPLTVQGDTSSSEYGSLQEGLSHIELATSFPGQGLPLVHDIVIYIDVLTVLCTEEAEFEFRVNNHLEASLTIQSVSGTASQSGVEYASYDYPFESVFTTTPGQAPGVYSPPVQNVKLVQKFIGSTGLLFNEDLGLDISLVSSTLIDQYNAPSFPYSQNAVPYTIQFVPFDNSPSAPANILADPVGTLLSMASDLEAGLATCVSGLFTNNTVSSLVSGVLSVATSVLGGVVSGVESAGASVLSDVASVGAGVASAASSDLGVVASKATSAAAVATSVVAALPTAAASVAAAPVAATTNVIGGAISALIP